MITIFHVVAFWHRRFPVTSGTPKLAQIFAYGNCQIAIPMQNATTRRVRSGPKMSENAQF